MKIEIWSDFSCSDCYLGERRLRQAIKQFGHDDNIQIEYRSYEIEPDTAVKTGSDAGAVQAKRPGLAGKEAEMLNKSAAKQVISAGKGYLPDKTVPANTFDAHRLMHFSKQFGKQKEIVHGLFHAYLIGGKHLANEEVLLDIATGAGLDRERVKQMLKSKTHEADVKKDEAEAEKLGAAGMPLVVINRKYAVSGARPVEIFLQSLHQAWREENFRPAMEKQA
ncbi:DsbA family oxidoreductase [Heyndrickxia acidiproducens]|uniref:DsbA family oxidoreductase n=1 Tax=Heyndrickxia acidiproducens TaxID=1121084 RepID=UPI0003656CEC|nr:DsbA family oxidoreductase [Heyndrickxia acidiproducens]